MSTVAVNAFMVLLFSVVAGKIVLCHWTPAQLAQKMRSGWWWMEQVGDTAVVMLALYVIGGLIPGA